MLKNMFSLTLYSKQVMFFNFCPEYSDKQVKCFPNLDFSACNLFFYKPLSLEDKMVNEQLQYSAEHCL